MEDGDSAGDVVNGETRPDPARLAQQAIIKQDVMLSGTTTQSPMSSVLLPHAMSLPAAASSGLGALTPLAGTQLDSMLLNAGSLTSAGDLLQAEETKLNATATLAVDSQGKLVAIQQQPVVTATSPPQPAAAAVTSGRTPLLILSNMRSATALTTPRAPSSQKSSAQVALSSGMSGVITGQNSLLGQPQGSGSTGGSLPIQQLLIPVSGSNGNQQLISIPVSLTTGSNGQLQLLTTASGQVVGATMSGGAQGQLAGTLAVGNSNQVQGAQVRSPIAQTNVVRTSVLATSATTTNSATQISLGSQASAQQALASVAMKTATGLSASTGVPQLITNAQGQIIGIANAATNQQVLTNGTSAVAVTPTSSAASTIHVRQLSAQQAAAALSSTTSGSGSLTMSSGLDLTPNLNQLLPNTVSNSTESTTVDGINLDDIKEFARQFKIRRLSLGLTQTQVGQALSATEGPSYSQSAICRFEKLDITPKSAAKIKPVLARWMQEAEERYKNGMQNLSDFIGSEPSKKRKRRTSFTPGALEVLNEHFERNTHPSGAEMTDLSDKLNYDREVIRVWFCNKRQALKNTIKKLKSTGDGI